MENRPPAVVELTWQGDLRFAARVNDHQLTIDGDGAAGISPVQALVAALASCMATDVVLILTRGRLPIEALEARIEAERAPSDPKRLTRVSLRFVVKGAVLAEKIERAIELSRETYCSVWHSLQPDIDFQTSYEIQQ